MPLNPLPSAADEAKLRTLAGEVRTELAAAGLPVLEPFPHAPLPPSAFLAADSSGSGVEVFVDDGVWAAWRIRGSLREASQRAFSVGAWQPDGTEMHPAIRHFGLVADTLNEAVATILEGLGYGVRRYSDGMVPGSLLISPRKPGPTWRDPAVPPLAGSAGYAPGVRVRLLGGDFAGTVTTVVGAVHELPPPGPPRSYRVAHPAGDGEIDVPPEEVTLAEDGS